MNRRGIAATLAALWAALAGALTVLTTAAANPDAKWIVALAGVVGVAAAVSACAALAAGKFRTAGAFLIVSAVAPTSFFYPPNIVAVVSGVALIAWNLHSERSSRGDQS